MPEGTRKALLVAGGIGVPPVLCLAGKLAEQGVAVDVCLGFCTASKAVGVDEFRSLCDTVNVCTDDGSLGMHGFCTDPAAELLGEGGYDYVASCGPAVMMKKVAAAAAEAGAYCEVSLERMMSCGFGACNTCNVETVDGMRAPACAAPCSMLPRWWSSSGYREHGRRFRRRQDAEPHQHRSRYLWLRLAVPELL